MKALFIHYALITYLHFKLNIPLLLLYYLILLALKYVYNTKK